MSQTEMDIGHQPERSSTNNNLNYRNLEPRLPGLSNSAPSHGLSQNVNVEYAAMFFPQDEPCNSYFDPRASQTGPLPTFNYLSISGDIVVEDGAVQREITMGEHTQSNKEVSEGSDSMSDVEAQPNIENSEEVIYGGDSESDSDYEPQPVRPAKRARTTAKATPTAASKRTTRSKGPAEEVTDKSPRRRDASTSPEVDFEDYKSPYPADHPNIVGTPQPEFTQTVALPVNNMTPRQVPTYNVSLPPYYENFHPTAMLKPICGNIRQNNFPYSRGYPPMLHDDICVDHGHWNKIYAAAAERMNKHFTRFCGVELQFEEYTELKARFRENGVCRWLAIQMLKDAGTLPADFYDDPQNH